MYMNFFLDDRHSYRLFLIKFPPALVVSSCSSCSCNEKSSCKISSSLEVVDSSVASSSGLSEKKMTWSFLVVVSSKVVGESVVAVASESELGTKVGATELAAGSSWMIWSKKRTLIHLSTSCGLGHWEQFWFPPSKTFYLCDVTTTWPTCKTWSWIKLETQGFGLVGLRCQSLPWPLACTRYLVLFI